MGRQHLNDEDKQRVRILYTDGGFSVREICNKTSFSKSQVNRALFTPQGPRRRKGPAPAIGPAEEAQMIEFIEASQANRLMTWLKISTILFNGIFGLQAIRNAFRRLGYKRYIARSKPPLSPKNIALRLAFAREHVNWTYDQWCTILWSDETWVTGGLHTKPYVTRQPDEEYDPNCVIERIQRRRGWMFWGCFAGRTKGPGIFWEKDWGTITEETYRDHIVPIIDGWLELQRREGVQLVFMQDNAPAHHAKGTQEDLEERGVSVIEWPPYSPDLNPIETVWDWMKDYIQEHFGVLNQPSYDRLRIMVNEAWEAVPEEWLEDLVRGLHKRCEEVIAAEGRHIRH